MIETWNLGTSKYRIRKVKRTEKKSGFQAYLKIFKDNNELRPLRGFIGEPKLFMDWFLNTDINLSSHVSGTWYHEYIISMKSCSPESPDFIAE